MKKSYSRPLPALGKGTIVLFYIFVASLWLALTEWALALLVDDALRQQIQVVKACVFIVLTALFFYGLLGSYVRAAIRSEHERLALCERTVVSWVDLLDVRHKETRDHTMRVARMTENFASVLGIHGDKLENIRLGAMLHDIGKLSVPDHIINKPGGLTEDEWVIMKKHPETARRLLSNIDYLDSACIDIPYCHHERWDGNGYPQGLAGSDIPYAARLFAVVDVWESMTAQRVYKEPVPEDEILRHIEANAGSQFDPELAQFFVQHYEQIRDYGTTQ